MDKLIQLYKKQLNLENSLFSQIKHDDALISIVYKIEQPDKTQLLLKICDQPRHYFREVYFLNKFQGILPVPRIIDVVKPSANVQGAILMEFISGFMLQKSELYEKLAYEIGGLLAGIHLNTAEAYGDLTEPNNLTADPKEYFTFKFEADLNECKDNLSRALLEQCKQYYDTHKYLLTTVDGPCIIHRDFRPGNIIVKNDTVQSIIDWSAARAGFAEDDFYPLARGKWSNNAAYKAAILAGYSSIRPIPNYEAIMPLLILNRAIAAIGFTAKSGTWDNSNSHLYKSKLELLENFLNNTLSK